MRQDQRVFGTRALGTITADDALDRIQDRPWAVMLAGQWAQAGGSALDADLRAVRRKQLRVLSIGLTTDDI